MKQIQNLPLIPKISCELSHLTWVNWIFQFGQIWMETSTLWTKTPMISPSPEVISELPILRRGSQNSCVSKLPQLICCLLKWSLQLPWVRVGLSPSLHWQCGLRRYPPVQGGIWSSDFDQRKLTFSFIPKVTQDMLFWIILCESLLYNFMNPQASPCVFELPTTNIYTPNNSDSSISSLILVVSHCSTLVSGPRSSV